MSLEKEVRDGILAKSVLDSLDGRLTQIKENLHVKWETSKAEDTSGREQAWMMLKAVNELERSYLREIDTGKLAQMGLNEKEGKKDG